MEPDQEKLYDREIHENTDVMSWVSVCLRGLWRVQQRVTHESTLNNDPASHHCPRLGSVCTIRVQIDSQTKADQALDSEEGNQKSENPEDSASTFPRSLSAVIQVPLREWTTLRLGEGQCDITEACLERMKTGDKCEILLSPLEADAGGSTDTDQCYCATVELQSFTPGKESWELSPAEKIEWVKFHKDRGGVRFRSGDVWGAADSYSRALKLLIPLYGQVTEVETILHPSPDSSLPSAKDYRTIKAELHSNLSLCQLKLKQPEQARASAAKATALEPSGTKAWYRLGQACQMVHELGEAKRAFKKLLELQPDSSAAIKALKDVALKEKETNKELGHRLSKMFT